MTAFVQERPAIAQIALTLDAIIGRLTYDEDFVASLARDPYATLDQAGLHIEKEAIESFIEVSPERFDKICDRLAELINPEILTMLSNPSCG